jgi:hypothetical protein
MLENYDDATIVRSTVDLGHNLELGQAERAAAAA